HQKKPERQRFGVNPQAFARNDSGAQFGELPFARLRIPIEKILRKDQLEHRIPEEFQPLIIKMVPVRFVAEAGVGEGFGEEEGIAELILDALLQRIHAGCAFVTPVAPKRLQKSPSLRLPELDGIPFRIVQAREASRSE